VPTASKVDVSKHGLMKFREERMLGLGGFNERYFILNGDTLRMYKEIRVTLTRFTLGTAVLFSIRVPSLTFYLPTSELISWHIFTRRPSSKKGSKKRLAREDGGTGCKVPAFGSAPRWPAR